MFEYATGYEYARILHMPVNLNMPGLHRVLNMPEKFLNVPEYAGICVNMPKICLNEWLLFYISPVLSIMKL